MNDARVASVQMQHIPGEKAANLEKIATFVRQAADQDVALILFPEM
ncbi:MAG: nitrilase-related carbon-nitrogen hydrolase, partial [Calditrichota bacterium]